VRHGLDLCRRHGIVPSYAIYEPGFMRLGAALARCYDGVPQPVDLSNGATQTTLSLPAGVHTLRLRFVDDTGRRDLTPVSTMRLVVSGQDRL
jgi:hypothetical protein